MAKKTTNLTKIFAVVQAPLRGGAKQAHSRHLVSRFFATHSYLSSNHFHHPSFIIEPNAPWSPEAKKTTNLTKIFAGVQGAVFIKRAPWPPEAKKKIKNKK
jgi:hypothetical protein